MSYINSYVFFLSSAYRTSGSNAVPVWLLDRGLSLSDPGNEFHASVLSAEIPFAFSTITASYNTVPFLLVVPELSINTSGVLTVPTGNYTILTLLAAFSTAVSQGMTSAGFGTINQATLSFTYDITTSRTTLDYSVAPLGYSVALTIFWGQSDLLCRFFGHDALLGNTTISYTNTGTKTSVNYVSPSAVNVNPITSVCLRSDLLQQSAHQMERYVEAGWAASNIIAKMPVTTGSNTWLFFRNEGFSVKLHNKSIESVDIYLTGLTFDALLLNGVSWSVVLEIKEWEPRSVEFNREQQLIRAYDHQTRLEDLQRERTDLQAKVTSSLKKIRGSIKQHAEEQAPEQDTSKSTI